MKYVKHETISMRTHPEFNERWVQDRLAEDPSILGLGELVLKDKERVQPRAGRLDLLFQDSETTRRYEVEVQLGSTDESHIIRTLEYWDLERKRYPKYEHTAVIVAEDITSRFLNVISLFNGSIPLVAIQMKAVRLGDQVSLVCTTVLDQLSLGSVDDEEEVREVTDRSYWEKQAAPDTVGMVDEFLTIIRSLEPGLDLKYNKFYIGLAKNGHPWNFVIFRPKKQHLRIEPFMRRDEEMEGRMEEAGIDLLGYDARWRNYKLRLAKGDMKKHAALLSELFARAHKEFTS